MKLAIVSPYISTPTNVDCYQSQQMNLALELAKLGLEVDIITGKRSSGDPQLSMIGEQIGIYRLPTIGKWLERFFNQCILIGLWKRLRVGQYDIVQSSEDCALSTLIAGIYSISAGSRLIVYQGVYRYSHRWLITALMMLYDRIAGTILRRACSVAVCKTTRAATFLRNKGYAQIRVIPVGVNTSVFHPGERREPGREFRLLAVGNLIPLKNYPLVLNAFKQLTLLGCEARLTIIGSGPEKEKIVEFLSENRLMEKVQLLEGVPNARMRDYYVGADLLLLFSTTEIFGMVMLEAMACGCPVIATATPGAADVIVDCVNSFIVSDDDPGRIASQIAGILSNRSEWAKVREQAIRTAHEEHSWSVIAERYHNLYSEGVQTSGEDSVLSKR